MSQISTYPKFRAKDANDVVIAGGLLYTYDAGTSNEKTTYSDAALTTPNANPVVLDTNGEAEVYYLGAIKMVLTTAGGGSTPFGTQDNIPGSTSTQAEINTASTGISNPPIAGDSTAGRVLRVSSLEIANGTAADSLKCTLTSKFNGDTISETDDIVHNLQVGNFFLSQGGLLLRITDGGLTGLCVQVISAQITRNRSTTGLSIYGYMVGDDIGIILYSDSAGVSQDMRALVDVGNVELEVVYLTDE